jgi:hypothetical protein
MVGFSKVSFPSPYSVQVNFNAPGETGENNAVGYGSRFQGELPEGLVTKTFIDYSCYFVLLSHCEMPISSKL